MTQSFVLTFRGLTEKLQVNQASAHIIKAGLFQGYPGDRSGTLNARKQKV